LRKLLQQEAKDIIIGACILGTSEGGNLKEGLALIRNLYGKGRYVNLVSLEEVEDKRLIASLYYVGSVAPLCTEELP
jgi:DUF917 family protein